MPYNKLNISGAQADVLSWVSHGLTLDEENMLRNVSRLALYLQARRSDAGRTP